jgi:hypothetical protein
MGFGWEEVHDIAEEVEHIKSPAFFEKMDLILSNPKFDPHGTPIPDKEGKLPKNTLKQLSSIEVGKKGLSLYLKKQEAFTNETLVWHDEANLLRCIPIQVAKSLHFDLVIATWWKTALELPDFSAPRYAYFVQSIESRFYSSDEAPLRQLVDETYRLPVSCITEATWIQRHLRDHFHQEAALVRNGIRKDIYKIDGTWIAVLHFVLKTESICIDLKFQLFTSSKKNNTVIHFHWNGWAVFLIGLFTQFFKTQFIDVLNTFFCDLRTKSIVNHV